MIKIQIEKIDNTCIIWKSITFYPTETKNGIDYYDLPCDFEENRIQVIHYSGKDPNSIKANFDYDKPIHKELKSLDIDLHYCRLEFNIRKTKSNNFLKLKVCQNRHKDMIGQSTYCNILVIQKKNVIISNPILFFFKNNKFKYLVFLIEFMSQLGSFILIALGLILWGYDCIRNWYTPHLYVGPYPFFLSVIPLGIFAIVLIILEYIRIRKNTLLVGKNINTKDDSLC